MYANFEIVEEGYIVDGFNDIYYGEANEGIKDFFKGIGEKIRGFFGKIKALLDKLIAKIKNFIFKTKSKEESSNNAEITRSFRNTIASGIKTMKAITTYLMNNTDDDNDYVHMKKLEEMSNNFIREVDKVAHTKPENLIIRSRKQWEMVLSQLVGDKVWLDMMIEDFNIEGNVKNSLLSDKTYGPMMLQMASKLVAALSTLINIINKALELSASRN